MSSVISLRSSEESVDPLSDVLALLKLRSFMAGGFDIGGQVSLHFNAHNGIKCYALVSGACWLCLDGETKPMRLETGDCFLLPHGRPFSMATDLGLEQTDALAVFSCADRAGGVAVINGGGSFCIVGGFFAFEGHHSSVLLGSLPSVVHLKKESDKAAMRWSLERMREELLNQQPGGSLVAKHLAQMMLVQALRLHLADGQQGGVGWLFALADRQMSAAIRAMHGDPSRRWTLETLAGQAGMSRSIFAVRFKDAVGTSPMEYLTRWRMLLAGDRLTNTSDPISEIATALSYESESAFSTAFKRVMGCSPRQYSRRRSAERKAEFDPHSAPAHLMEAVAG